MDLDLSEEQQMIIDMTRGMLEEHCTVDVVRSVEDDPKGYPDVLWKQMGELGLNGLLIPESYGGGGLGVLEAAHVYEELGRAMAPVPHFVSCVMAAGVLMEAGSDVQKDEWLPKLADGSAILTPAWYEPDHGQGELGVQLEAKRDGDDYVLNGVKRSVPYASAADRLLVLARSDAGVELLLVDRQARREDDLISALLDAEIDGEHLTREEILGFCFQLIVAGNDTTTNLIGNGAVLLARHPEQRALLVADPSRIPNAVEEVLRYEAPSPIQARWCTRDVEFHGQTLPARSKVGLLTASANRDEREFPDADCFDVDRKIDRHVGLGFGIHFCLGASLARLEGRVAIEETLRRFPLWDVDRDGLERVHRRADHHDQ